MCMFPDFVARFTCAFPSPTRARSNRRVCSSIWMGMSTVMVPEPVRDVNEKLALPGTDRLIPPEPVPMSQNALSAGLP